MKALQIVVFILGCVADVLMAPLTIALKGSDDTIQYFWLGLAITSVAGFATRIFLLRRGTETANAWARALAPTRLGAMMFGGVLVLVAVLIPIVALLR